ITASETWTANNVYLLDGWVYVKDGATLTIEPGTVIRGDYNTKGSLIIERGAKLNAVGTSSQPIIFTSGEDAGNRDYGDWGGIILCGKATINVTGGDAEIEGGVGSHYGGGISPDDNDNSGSLKFVRIEFPGVPFLPDKEINGLTFGGVGRGTEIDYVQVSYSGDDAYEWFGGTVNCKHLVTYRTWDDDYDTDYGYSGMIQYAVALRDPAIADPGSGSNGFESDNNGSGTDDAPYTQAVFSNFSMFGPKVTQATATSPDYKRAMHLRRNTKLKVYNSIFAGYKDGLMIDGTSAETNATNDELKMYNCIIAGVSGSYFTLASGSSWDIRSWYFDSSRHNDTLVNNSDLMISGAFNLSAPNFLPQTGSPALGQSFWASVNQNNSPDFQAIIMPNPVKDNAIFNIELNQNSRLNISVYNNLGELVQVVANENLPEGNHAFGFNAASLPSGLYFARISANQSCQAWKIVVE
ncbi:MAG: T9SS type A sorting domain-containing protein, partial [Bacteroidetes bacterium]|nr:T9SS type A sorting domain-containing protein [Bacteroidota bacterium]